MIRSCEPEILFSFYYRKLISAKILGIPPRGCYNLHGSLLPRFRGRSPTNWAILLGEKKTGVTLHEMVVKADAGVIVGQREVEIGEDDDARAVLMKQVCDPRFARRSLPASGARPCTRYRRGRAPSDKVRGSSSRDGAIDWNQAPNRFITWCAL